MKCDSCKQVLEEGWKYCPYCKTEITLCTNCKNLILEKWKYCPYCKHKINDIEISYLKSNEWLTSILKED